LVLFCQKTEIIGFNQALGEQLCPHFSTQLEAFQFVTDVSENRLTPSSG
jgi:hypothetical protein